MNLFKLNLTTKWPSVPWKFLLTHYGLAVSRVAASSYNNYICVSDVPLFTGYEGTMCEYEIDECQSDPCQNGGQCTDLVNQYRCQCPVGFHGSNCENEINQCEGNPCLNGATCTNRRDSYICSCVNGMKKLFVGTYGMTTDYFFLLISFVNLVENMSNG